MSREKKCGRPVMQKARIPIVSPTILMNEATVELRYPLMVVVEQLVPTTTKKSSSIIYIEESFGVRDGEPGPSVHGKGRGKIGYKYSLGIRQVYDSLETE